MRSAGSAIALVLAGVLLAGCAEDVPDDAPVPDGVTVTIDQSRVLRKTRTVFLRVHNGSPDDLRVTGFDLTSPRFDRVRWTGDEIVGATYDADLEFEMPRGRCGDRLDAQAVLEYSVDGEQRRSTVAPTDPYGAAALFLDRDCTQLTLDEAARLTLGETSVSGTGKSSVLSLPVTVTPTGQRDDVVLAGFGSTVLFSQAAGSDDVVDEPLIGDPLQLVIKLVPARCDPHALGEDKVGTLIPVQVEAPGLPQNSTYYLPIGAERRSALFAFFKAHCGLVG